MELYPVCPAIPKYVIGSPLFQKMRLHLENGNTFDLLANDNDTQHPYIQAACLNGQAFKRTFIGHEELMDGGLLEFKMGKEPNKVWSIDSEATPYSMNKR